LCFRNSFLRRWTAASPVEERMSLANWVIDSAGETPSVVDALSTVSLTMWPIFLLPSLLLRMCSALSLTNLSPDGLFFALYFFCSVFCELKINHRAQW
jgi:hypothetical protein